jgi:pimeloyl-ACP methyl ester carboxylesterase
MKRKLFIVALLVLPVLMSFLLVGYWTLLRRSPGAYFDGDGVRLFYSDAGAGDVVVLLHGFAVNGDLNWRLNGLIKTLSNEYRVLTLDQRGHGLSGKPHDPDAYGEEMAHDVVRLMNHLQIDKAHVAGYSLGGFVALKTAALYPDRLLSVAVLGAGWQNPEDERSTSIFDDFDKLAKRLESGRGVEPVATSFSEGDHRPTVWHRLQVRLVSSLLGDKKALAAMLRQARDLALTRDELEALTVPMLVVCGDIDPNYTCAVNLKEAFPACEFVTVVNRSHPATALSKELRTSLLRFLEAHP